MLYDLNKSDIHELKTRIKAGKYEWLKVRRYRFHFMTLQEISFFLKADKYKRRLLLKHNGKHIDKQHNKPVSIIQDMFAEWGMAWVQEIIPIVSGDICGRAGIGNGYHCQFCEQRNNSSEGVFCQECLRNYSSDFLQQYSEAIRPFIKDKMSKYYEWSESLKKFVDVRHEFCY